MIGLNTTGNSSLRVITLLFAVVLSVVRCTPLPKTCDDAEGLEALMEADQQSSAFIQKQANANAAKKHQAAKLIGQRVAAYDKKVKNGIESLASVHGHEKVLHKRTVVAFGNGFGNSLNPEAEA
mmetsp:Transcript_14785/g.29153  ORF Transcript_14785/g.29153 Transcript_14785/m.29153 type:complete len:124 (+) Transcript_14785:75-446(+)|eukprot:CAMPEP_0172871964 /NCGR_PEP_ID=MMETSP1075-20121228/92382_1 /TAXON_ID=2916 /ORGANISM="Ceratium fusus, Strain PA161109" /LENGTH=123 /DNA_ID=CAMNT_0013722267 /DNA_START=75 /DNA_END=446 /DNA_ORIENTATION=-